MNPNLKSNSYKNLLLGRLSCAVVSSVSSQVFALFGIFLLVKINLFNPLRWMKETLQLTISWETWLLLTPVIILLFLQNILCAKDYIVQPEHYSTRFRKWYSILSIHNCVLGILHILNGGAIIWLCLLLTNEKDRYIYTKCEEQKYCLIADNLFMLLCGFWIGFYYFVKFYVGSKRITFPVIQQTKLVRFKSKAVNALLTSITAVQWPVLYFSFFYFLCGSYICDLVTYTLRLHLTIESSFFARHIYASIYCSLYFFNMNLKRIFFELFLTEPVQFPLIPSSSLSLTDAITLNNVPIVQHLACLDLHLLSIWSFQRRQIFFQLSQPGGHPHNWNNLVEISLKLLTEYKGTLNKYIDMISSTEKDKTTALEATVKTINYENMRNMSIQSTSDYLNAISYADTETQPNAVRKRIAEIIAKCKKKIGYNYIFDEVPEMAIEQCLLNSQVIIWICQGLSRILSASYKEDSYGVVQKDLPIIVSSLIELKLCLNKLNKLPTFTRRSFGNDDMNTKLKNSVAGAAQRSVYQICDVFCEYLKEFPLNDDVWQYIQNNVMSKSNCVK